LTAGVAIDITGREIVIAEDQLLSETDFDLSNVANTGAETWYPVFLQGVDSKATQNPVGEGACASSLPTRIIDSYSIQFGRPGDELDWENQASPVVESGPGNHDSRVLLGRVQWNSQMNPGRFKKLDAETGRRYAGVQADVVAARSGKLEFRNRTDIQAGMPALIIDDDKTDGPRLRFGLLTADGVLTPVFTVSAKGDVKTEGVISGALTPGTVLVESGVATDGLILPLPQGITEEQVASGKVALHIQVTPRIPPVSDTGGVTGPLECGVDASRRVFCFAVLWTLPDLANSVISPGACSYTVLASVPPTSGGAL
jgi:hypothetical protein